MRQLYFVPLFLMICFQSFGQAEHPIEIAEKYFLEKNYESSLEILEKFVQDFPDRKYDLAYVYFLMSDDYLYLKEFDAAIWANQKSLDLRHELNSNEEIIENYVRFGEIAVLENKYDEALEYLMDAANLPFVDPEIYAKTNYNIAQLLHAQGKHQEANDYYQITSQILSIEFGEDYDQLIPVYLNQCRLALAMDSYDKAVYFASKIKPLISKLTISIEELIQPLLQTFAELSMGKYKTKTASELLHDLLVDAVVIARS